MIYRFLKLTSLCLLFGLFLIGPRCEASITIEPPFDAQAAGLSPGDTYHVMFATSQTFNITADRSVPPSGGEFGGIEAASWQTTLLAAQAGLVEDWNLEDVIYRAVLSDNTADARDHITIAGKVFNTQGEKLADDFDDFFDGSVDTPIAYDQNGELITSAQEKVWSGSTPDGRTALNTCGCWDDQAAGSAQGGSYSTTSWYSGPSIECSSSARLLAISPPLKMPIPEPTRALAMGGLFAMWLMGGKRRGNE